MNKGQYRRYALVGPGGIKCPCCVGQSRKPQTLVKRQAKRREARDLERNQRD